MVESNNPSKIGVWIENGMVWRSDIGENRNPRVPKKGHTPDEVAELVGKIQKIGRGDDVGNIDELLDKLDEIAIERGRFFKAGEKSP